MPAYRTQKFCSLQCANLLLRLKFPIKWALCANCEKEFVKQYKAQKFCSISCYAKVNPINQQRVIQMPSPHDPRFAELLGILAGDGTIGPHYMSISLNAKEDGAYPFFVRNLILDLFGGCVVTVNFQKRDNVHRVQFSSMRAISFLKEIWPKRHKIPGVILNNENLHIPFVRGLVDTEGTIGFKPFCGRNGNYLYKQLTFTNYNIPYRKIVYKTLKRLGFRPTLPARNIYISNKEDIAKYFEIIGSHNPKMLKKNSIETYDNYLDYRHEKATISQAFDNFRKYGGVAEWLKCTSLENWSPV